MLQLMLIYAAIQWTPIAFDQYMFPFDANAVGWLLVIGELLVVFVYTLTMIVIADLDEVSGPFNACTEWHFNVQSN